MTYTDQSHLVSVLKQHFDLNLVKCEVNAVTLVLCLLLSTPVYVRGI